MLRERLRARWEAWLVFRFPRRNSNATAALELTTADAVPPVLSNSGHADPKITGNDAASPDVISEPPKRSDREAVKLQNASVYAGDLRLQDDFRLLRIEGGTGEICASLTDHDLTSPPDYDALSYSWGSHQTLQKITVNGALFSVSSHLHDALLRLRRPTTPRLVWVDIICVNQANIPERNYSVKLMWKIYAQARRVIIWIGEIDRGQPTCKRLFAETPAMGTALTWCTQPGLPAMEHGHVNLKLEDYFSQLEVQSIKNNGDVWWKRLWVIQEFSQARELPTVYIGSHAISWNFFTQIMRTEYNDRLQLFQHLRDGNNPRGLLQLLSLAKRFYCSDPKDRIYALLGLVQDGRTPIQPNYGEDVDRVYEDATLYIIQAERNLDMLLDERLERCTSSYPTWVPRFTMLRDRSLTVTKDNLSAAIGIDPVVDLVNVSSTSPTCHLCFSNTGRALTVKAMSFGRITARTSENDMPVPGSTHRKILNFHGNQSKIESSRPLQMLDGIYDKLKIDFRKPPSLPIYRPPTSIAFLMLHFLFGGMRSAAEELVSPSSIGATMTPNLLKRIEIEIDRLSKKHHITFTKPQCQDLRVVAKWENAFLTLRHKGIFHVMDDETPTASDTQKTYELPSNLRQRDFFAIDGEFIAMGPATLEVGDHVVVPLGASRPFILRQHSDHFTLIGDAVVPGIMSRQLVNMYEDGTIDAKTFTLR